MHSPPIESIFSQYEQNVTPWKVNHDDDQDKQREECNKCICVIIIVYSKYTWLLERESSILKGMVPFLNSRCFIFLVLSQHKR
mmetsp:Transcript_6245/g.7166  ORF Transcript_6245/g.7166 Transcript_6245/m.7166 type:complete len:83 (-) Transcript_6245:1041-1289(-)